MNNLEQVMMKKRRPIRVIYVSSYIPRRCGIATYTKDLTNAINLLNPHALAEIMAINRNGGNLEYPWEVKFKINQNDLSTYLHAADYINQSGADLVSLQHEYGLFGGYWGEYIVSFAELLKLPLITTLHSAINDPKSQGGVIMKRLIAKSAVAVVMMEKIKEKFVRQYNVPDGKIVSILHGTPDLPYTSTAGYKKKRKLMDRIILGNINLLSPSRGVEYALEAVSLIAKKYPNVLYLVIGQTHPVDLQIYGEAYRNLLKKTVKKLRIEKNVRFINKYLSLDELISWLRTIDFYITPYLDPNQAASGGLAYAVGAGKCCISTSYIYAQEVLASGRGVLVPFRSPKAISESVIELWENPDKKSKMEKSAYEYGRLMTWSNVALQYLDLFRTVLRGNGTLNHKDE